MGYNVPHASYIPFIYQSCIPLYTPYISIMYTLYTLLYIGYIHPLYILYISTIYTPYISITYWLYRYNNVSPAPIEFLLPFSSCSACSFFSCSKYCPSLFLPALPITPFSSCSTCYPFFSAVFFPTAVASIMLPGHFSTLKH